MRKRIGSLPCVRCDESVELPGDVVTPDYAEAGRLAIRALPRQARRVTCLIRPGIVQQRFADAARRAAGERRLTVRVLQATQAPAELSAALAQTDAVLCGDDELAALVEGWLLGLGRDVGGEVCVIGLGNTPLCDTLPVPLTSIDPGLPELATRAFDTARARIEHTRRDAPSQTRIAPRLVPRSSCPVEQ